MEKEKTIKLLKCNQCKYKWYPRTNNPKQCPNCKRQDWNEENKQNGK